MPTSPLDPPSGTTSQPLLDPAPPRTRRMFVQRASPVNLALIVGSVLLTLWTNFGQNEARLLPWVISLASAHSPEWLFEVRHGEVWRLLTPAFLHFSVAHIGFNLINLWALGNVLERRIGSRAYLGGTVAIALASNLLQYFATRSGSPLFGGMSGVVYGLFGYVWLRARTDRTFGLALPEQTLVIALGWLVLCFTGYLGPIANMAHVGGLALGVLWGVMDGRAAMRKARPEATF